jgi:Domain of unknown function (DUF4116)
MYLSHPILYSIYEKMSWYHLKDINNNIANSATLWKKHSFTLGVELPKDKLIQYLDNIISNVMSRDNDMYYNRKLLDDYWFILKLVQNYGWALGFAPDKFRQDRNIALTALKNNISGINFVDEKLKQNRNFALEAVKINYKALINIDRRLQFDPEIIITALKQNIRAADFLFYSIKQKPELVDIILEGMKDYPITYKYLVEKLKME